MNSVPTFTDDEARPDVDALLRGYFQKEMPCPWPMLSAPMPVRSRQADNTWLRYSGRLALAACVALMVAGYLTLAGYFPRSQSPDGVHSVVPDTAMKDNLNKSGLPKVQGSQPEETQASPMPMKLENTGR